MNRRPSWRARPRRWSSTSKAKLGMKVEFTPVTDYAAVGGDADQPQGRPGLVRRLHLRAGLGARSGGKVIPLVQREEDERFKLGLHHHRPCHQDAGRPEGQGRELRFAKLHQRPPDAAQRAAAAPDVDPDKDFKRVAYSGAHDATIAAVAAGKVQAGALNISVWEKFVAEKKVDTDKSCACSSRRRLTTTTTGPCSAAMPEALREQDVAQAFLALDKQHAAKASRSWSCNAQPASCRAKAGELPRTSKRQRRAPACSDAAAACARSDRA